VNPRSAAQRNDHLQIRPGKRWRWLRRSVQALALVALLVGPLLGGWQRLDYTRDRSSWRDSGWALPPTVQRHLSVSIAPETLLDANRAMGGGIAAELFAIPFMDPLAGTLALLGSGFSWRSLIALGLPIGIALLGGRVFCGWFCVFGILARGLDSIVARIPRYRFRSLPPQRWVRWLVLLAAVLASLFGGHLLLYLALPYLLVQQSVYAAWLLGGGSAVAGVLGGLIVAGLVFGPTLYCSAICPTGATLSLLGRRRVFRIYQPDEDACGKHCDLCSRACWLQLDPGSGDPGPDCDLCARCVPSCPRTNLVITRSSHIQSRAPLTLLAVGALALTIPNAPARARDELQPSLILDAETSRADVTIAASAIDYTGFRLDADWLVAKDGVELSVFIARGPLRPPGADGIIPNRETYRGPLQVEVVRASGEGPETIVLPQPNSPMSAQRRRIYRSQLPYRLEPGDRVRIAPIPGWFDETIDFEVPKRGSRIGAAPLARYFGVSVLGFSGLLALALVGPRTSAPPLEQHE